MSGGSPGFGILPGTSVSTEPIPNSEFGPGGFGSFTMPGFLSPFDLNATGMAGNASMEAMANRYAQLGLSSEGATPSSPGGAAGGIGVGNIGANVSGPGPPSLPSGPTALRDISAIAGGGGTGTSGISGTPVGRGGTGDLGSTAGSGGTGAANVQIGPTGPGVQPNLAAEGTAEQMDLGQAKSLSGGIPAQFESLLGILQNANLQNASMSKLNVAPSAGTGGGKGGGGGSALGSALPLLAGGK